MSDINTESGESTSLPNSTDPPLSDVNIDVEDDDTAESISSLQPIVSNTTNPPEEPINPVLGQYHQACQKGDLATVKQLLDSGVLDLNTDLTGDITGLHWASINNRLSVVKYLISQGIDVNAKAGDLEATPLHWAARYGYVHIVDCLLNKGADPTMCDMQGFNLLHLAVNSSNVMLVAYVLFFVVAKGIIDIDCQDPKGRTPLLWAAYQGDSLSVMLLLKFGASTKIVDEGGFTPLHWATVKGQPYVLTHLIRDGADFFLKTNDGKDCFTIAQEMNTSHSFKDALSICGFNQDGYPKRKLFKKSDHAKVITFFVPLVALSIIFILFTHLHPLFALLISLIFGLAVNKALKELILPSYSNYGLHSTSLLKSPFLSGTFFGSLLLLTIVWIFKIAPFTIFKSRLLTNFFMFLILMQIYYLFIKLIFSDPGCVPIETDHENVRGTIKELLDTGKFDIKNFCLETWIRKPLRSHFSTLNTHNVARFDHFCPWIYNDIGLKNHKNFMWFILLTEVGIWFFISLTMKYFDILEDTNEDVACFLLGDDELCAGFVYDRFTFLIALWALIQSVWVGFLIVVQVFQTFTGVTNKAVSYTHLDVYKRQQ